MTVTLSPELENLVRRRVERGEFESVDAFVAHVVREALGLNGRVEEGVSETGELWDAFERILKDVPQEELQGLPKDFAAEHDHYIYGTPKRYS